MSKIVSDFGLQTLILSVALVLGSSVALPAFSVMFNREPWMLWTTTNASLAVMVAGYATLFASLGMMIGGWLVRTKSTRSQQKS